MTTMLVALAGAGVAAGVWLALLGLRGHAIVPDPRAFVGGRVGLEVIAGWTAAALFGTVVVFAATGWLVAAVAAAIGIGAIPTLGGDDRDAAMVRTEAIATWTEMIRDNIAGAAGLEHAIVATAELTPDAIAAQVRGAIARLDSMRLADSLAVLGDDLDDPAADLVIAALANASRMEARDVGGLLSRLADSIRADVRMRQRIEVGRARIRTSARVVIAVTIATVAYLFVFARDMLDAYDTAAGQVWLLVVLATFVVGGRLLHSYGEIEMPERFTARRHPEGREQR